MHCSTDYPQPKWYNHPTFPLLPSLQTKKPNEHNTRNFQFQWLFLKLWTLDAFGFEFAIVADTHWGIGFTCILPYVRWVCCLPCPQKWQEWAYKHLWRKPRKQPIQFEDLFGKRA